MGSSLGKGPNGEPEFPAAVWGAAPKAGLGPRGNWGAWEDRMPVVSLAARALPCGERHLPPTDRPLPVPSRHPLVPTQLSRLINLVRFSVGVKMKRGIIHLLLRGRGE